LLEHVLTRHRHLCRGAKTTGDDDSSDKAGAMVVAGGSVDNDDSSDKAGAMVVAVGESLSLSRSGSIGGGADNPAGSNQAKSECVLTRYELFQSIFPVVVRSNNVDIKYGRNVPITSTDPNNYHCMPPICQIDNILQNVNINKGAEIVLDYGSFSLQTIKLFKNVMLGR